MEDQKPKQKHNKNNIKNKKLKTTSQNNVALASREKQ